MEFDINQYSQHFDVIIEWGMRVISALLILIAGWMIGSWTRGRIEKINKLDKTISSFLGGLAKYAILAVSLIAVLGQFGIQTASLLAVLGAAGLAIGLALQGTLSNVAAGVMMLILRPFKVGDYIEFGSTGGTIMSLGLFGAELNTPDNKYIFAPNSRIWGNEITNYSRNKQRRQDIAVGISYDSDIDKAIKTVNKVLSKEKRLIDTTGKEPIIVVDAMADSSVNLKVRVWTKTEDFFVVQWDLKKAIKEQLDKDGIDIPFPTRTLEIANPEALKGK
jgi:small conductance mechanosensitive channel